MFFHFEQFCDNLEAQKHSLRLQMEKQQCIV